MLNLGRRAGTAFAVAAVVAIAPLSIAVTASAAAAAGDGSSGKPAAIATLKITNPNVEVKKKKADAFKPAKDGAELKEGDTVRTDATGLAEIDYGADAYTRLDVNTTFTIKKLTEDQGSRQVEGSLDTGQTWNRTAALTESGSFGQDGAGANATVRGTVFMVTCDTPTHCVFIAIEHTTALTGADGVTKDLTPHVACDSTSGDLCDATRTLTIDELAANDWIQTNLVKDLTERGLGDGPFVPVGATLTVVNGVVVSVEPGPPTPIATAPGAPTVTSVVADSGKITVYFSAPSSDGGSPITSYTATATPVVTVTSIFALSPPVAVSKGGTSSPIEITGLVNTATYTITVTAKNVIGSSPTSAPSSSVTPTGAPTEIAVDPVDIQGYSDALGDHSGETTGPGTQIVSQDERTVSFTVRVDSPSGTYWIVFTDLPAATFGQILDRDLVPVTTGDRYDSDTVFTFNPVEVEPVCSAEPATFADCFTNGNPSEGPDASAGTVSYPSPVTQGPVDGSVQWSSSFTFHTENDQGGVSADKTVPLTAVDDICTTNEEGNRPQAKLVVNCPVNP